MKNRRFLEQLVERGLVLEDQIEALEGRHRGDVLGVLEELIDTQTAPKEELCRLFGDTLGVAFVDLGCTIIQPEVVDLIPREFAAANRLIAIYSFANSVTVATADPLNLSLMDEVARHAGMPVSAVFSPPGDILDAIEVEYATLGVIEELKAQIDLDRLMVDDAEADPERLARMADDRDVVVLTRQILLNALKKRASDIHIEPSEHVVRIRLRVDGELQDWNIFDRKMYPALVSRLKLMAGCDITERRLPQDGRIALPLATHSVDLRFSSVPVMNGEKLTLRVLGSMERQSVPDLEELNLSAANLEELRRIIGTPNGVFFVTGPTGSGKTTTLYSVLKSVNRPGVNVMTVEDPVEYRLPDINQTQVNTAVDLTFAKALRAFLRQDPNVILVGEVRDMETAKIASQAALTGHLVMSTMHTNNALQAVTRLVEIGVEPFLVAPSIIGVSAQRLVRRLCTACREEQTMSADRVARYFGDIGNRTVELWRGRGCPNCNGTGYVGRVAIHEIFLLTESVRRLIAQNASILDIEKLAREHGFKPMLYDGIKKAMRGLTPIEEVEQACVQTE